MGVVELKDVGYRNQSVAPAQPLDPSVIIPPQPQFAPDLNQRIPISRCIPSLSPSASTMNSFVDTVGHVSSSSSEDPLYLDPSQIVNVSYGTMFNCLPCGKGSVDSQHLSRCANACAHKKDTRALLGRWQLACRQSREQGTPMPPPFRPPNPVNYVTKRNHKAGQGMIPPTLVRAYPGEQAFGAYETLRASVGPAGDYFPQEPPRMDGIQPTRRFAFPLVSLSLLTHLDTRILFPCFPLSTSFTPKLSLRFGLPTSIRPPSTSTPIIPLLLNFLLRSMEPMVLPALLCLR
jgi:hypothetical protein